jgi:hypothetical protein
VIGAGHQQAIVTLVERKSGFPKMTKVPQKKVPNWSVPPK